MCSLENVYHENVADKDLDYLIIYITNSQLSTCADAARLKFEFVLLVPEHAHLN